jgi:hypothetical protein
MMSKSEFAPFSNKGTHFQIFKLSNFQISQSTAEFNKQMNL